MMPFDLSTAKPVPSGFDLSTAQPVTPSHADPSLLQAAGQHVGNIVAGAVRGAGSIGATLLYPIDKATDLIMGDRGPTVTGLVSGKQPMSRNEERRAAMDEGLQSMGAEPDSWMYKGGKLAGEIAGTAGAGGVLANGVRAVAPTLAAAGASAPVIEAGANALATGGFRAGAAGTLSAPVNMLARIGGGAVTGGVSAGMIDPKNALAGAAVGGALPPALATIGKVGSVVGGAVNAVTDPIANALASRAARSQPLNDAFQSARDAGYVFPPSQSNPSSVLAHTADIVAGGRPTMAQAAALKNQPVTNSLAAKALGLPEDTQLSTTVLDKVRSDAYKAGYAPVKASGTVTPGPDYAKALDAIEQTSKGASRSFPAAVKSEIPDLVDSLRVQNFDAGDAIQMTQVLRNAADKAYRAGDNALGKANKDASKALEDAIEQHLQNSNMPDALSAFKDARTLIAKSYSVQKGLNDTTGDVSAKALTAQMKKGKPLTGELETIARAAQLPGNSLRDMQYATPGASQLEGATSFGAALAAHNPLPLLIPYARAGLRSTILSGPVQRNLPGNGAMMNALASNPAQYFPQSANALSALADRASPALYRSAPVLESDR